MPSKGHRDTQARKAPWTDRKVAFFDFSRAPAVFLIKQRKRGQQFPGMLRLRRK
jgi:hypothetical protein